MKKALLTVCLFLTACGQQNGKSPDLPNQPDKWVVSISLQSNSKASHVGKSSAILGATTVKPISGLSSMSIGDDIDGVHIGAIRCVFFQKDASYSGEQYMWRGKWGCQAGRSKDEIQNAVQEDGTKLYDYIYVAPVALNLR